MADYITKIHTIDGDKQIDYNALANLPDLSLVGEVKILDSDDNVSGVLSGIPIRGIDYWTAADIAEIKSYVNEAILGGAW